MSNAFTRALREGYFESLGAALAMPFAVRELYLKEHFDEPPASLRFLFRLKRLKFANLRRITPRIARLGSLEELAVLSPVDEITEEIGRLRRLRSLKVSFTERASPVPASLWSLTGLELLQLSNAGLRELPPAFEALERLRELWITWSPLERFPPAILKLRSLTKLILWGTAIERLPEALFDLTELEDLSLGARLRELSPAIGRLRKLKDLGLSDSALTAIPEEIGQLTQLSRLQIGGNRLTGVPETLGDLAALRWLSLQKNSLDRLPDSIGGLRELRLLYLANNRLRGLPPSIGQLSRLTELDLQGNQLTSLPGEIGELENLQKLDLRANRLTCLPPALASLRAVKSLLVGQNPFSVEERGRILDAHMSQGVTFSPAEAPPEADRSPLTEHVPGSIWRPDGRRSEIGFRYAITAKEDKLVADVRSDHDDMPITPLGVVEVAELPGGGPDGYRDGARRAGDELEARFRAHAMLPQLPSASRRLAVSAGEPPDELAATAARCVALTALAAPLAVLLREGGSLGQESPERARLGHLARAALIAAFGTLDLLHPEHGPRSLEWPFSDAFGPPPAFPAGRCRIADGHPWHDVILEYDSLYQAYVRQVGQKVAQALALPVEDLRGFFLRERVEASVPDDLRGRPLHDVAPQLLAWLEGGDAVAAVVLGALRVIALV